MAAQENTHLNDEDCGILLTSGSQIPVSGTQRTETTKTGIGNWPHGLTSPTQWAPAGQKVCCNDKSVKLQFRSRALKSDFVSAFCIVLHPCH